MLQAIKFGVSTVMAIAAFSVLAALTIDFATYLFGKPTRGVSYGIGLYYLHIAVTVIGGLALLCANWLGMKLPLAFAAVGICSCVLLLFGQPSIAVRIGVAAVIVVILAAIMGAYSRVLRKGGTGSKSHGQSL